MGGMRLWVGAAVTVLAASSFAVADTGFLVHGSACAEDPTAPLVVTVRSRYPAVVAHGAPVLEPLAVTTVQDGRWEVAMDRDSLPVRVEVAGSGHVAAAIDLFFADRAELPPVFLLRGSAHEVLVRFDGGPAAGARVLAEYGRDDRVPWTAHWFAVVSPTLTDAEGRCSIRLPDAEGSIKLWAVADSGRWGTTELRLPAAGERTEITLDSVAATVMVGNNENTAVPAAAVSWQPSPWPVLVLTGDDGRATVFLPPSGAWQVSASAGGSLAAEQGLGTVRGPLRLVAIPPSTVVLQWDEVPSPWMIRAGWLPEAGGLFLAPGTPGAVALPLEGETGELTAGGPELVDLHREVGPGQGPMTVELLPAATMSGAVVNPDQTPAPRVPVWLLPAGDAEPVRPWQPTTATDDGGRFAITGVQPGRWLVEAGRPGAATGRSRVLTAVPGAHLSTDLVLAHKATLRVRIVDESGRGQQGARVEVYRLPVLERRKPSRGSCAERAGHMVRPVEKPAGVTTAAADGTARLEVATPGEVMLRVCHSGFVPMVVGPVTLPAEGVDLGELVLERGETVDGVVLTDVAQPLAGATVLMATTVHTLLGEPVAVSDAAGRFEAPDLPRHTTLVLTAEAPGWAAMAPVRLELEDQPVSGVEIVLSPCHALEGVVIAADDGSPVDRASVSLLKQRRLGGAGSSFNLEIEVAATSTGPAGRFGFNSPEPGDFAVRVAADGFREHTEAVAISGDGQAAEPLTITLQRQPEE